MMEIEVGYKMSELGPIPMNWTLVSLREIGRFIKGKGIRKDQILMDGIPCVRYGELYTIHNEYIKVINSFIDEDVAKDSQRINYGDILFAGSGETKEEIGKCAAFLERKEAYAGGDVIIFSPINQSSLFLGFLLNHSLITKQKALFGQGDSVVHIYINGLSKIKIPLPPYLEQQTIATALSETDSLINSLEKLIVKKKAIKQGAMQELLGPKEGWIKKKLGIDSVIKARIGWQGLTTREYKQSGSYLLITGTEFKNGIIEWEDCFYVEEERYLQDKNIQVQNNDVLVTKDGTIGKVAIIKEFPLPATLNSGIFVIRPKNNSFFEEFFYYVLLSETFKLFLSQLTAGSTINHLYQKDFVIFEFMVPPTIEEQSEIAQILSTMDSEITTLEQQLSKYKLIKQGMMEQLLIGKTRLNYL